MLFIVPPGIPARAGAVMTRLARARDVLHDRGEGAPTVAAAAKEAAMSPCHFIRTFKAVFGATPRQARIDARIERARQLLALDTASVTEICFAVGFSSLGSFSALFARRVGVAPSAYRRDARALVQVPGTLPPLLYPGCFSLMARWPSA